MSTEPNQASGVSELGESVFLSPCYFRPEYPIWLHSL